MPKIRIGIADSRAQLSLTAQGLIAEAFPRSAWAGGATAPATGIIFASMVGLRAGDTVTNCVCQVATAASGTAPTLIKMALLSKTGVVLGQSSNLNSDSRWTSTGPKLVALGSAVTASTTDAYYVAFLKVGTFGTTDVALARMATAASLLVTGSLPPYPGQSGQTDFAANAASQTLTDSVSTTSFWFAVA